MNTNYILAIDCPSNIERQLEDVIISIDSSKFTLISTTNNKLKTTLKKYNPICLIENFDKKIIDQKLFKNNEARICIYDKKDIKTLNNISNLNNTIFVNKNNLDVLNLKFKILEALEIRKLKFKLKEKEKKIKLTEKNAKSKNYFFANISHELKTPLNGIVGFIDVLLNSIEGSLEKEYLKLCKESTNHLEYLVNDLLDFSKIEEGKLNLEEKEFDLGHAINQCILTNAVSAKSKNIRINLKGNIEEKFNVVGDQYRLKQILNNLISNAIKFSNYSSIIDLTINTKTNKNNSIICSIEVKDYGIGISKNKIETILKPFTQADNSTTRVYGGTGLGLTITNSLIKKMGGKLKIVSEPDNGSSFSFSIKFKEGVKEDIINTKKLILKNILIAEDNEINRKLIKAIFKNTNYNIHFATTGIEAIKAFKNLELDLILMDINMPEMDGITASKIIKKENKEIPILVLSAQSDDELKKNIENTEIDGYLSKPLNRENLFAKISSYTDK